MKSKGPIRRRGRRARLTLLLRIRDHRRFPRAEAQLDVAVEAPGHRLQKGTISGLNPFGAKLHLRAKQSAPAEGTTVQLRLTPPDGDPPMTIKGLVWRKDSDGQALVFVNLSTDDFFRLKRLVPARGAAPA